MPRGREWLEELTLLRHITKPVNTLPLNRRVQRCARSPIHRRPVQTRGEEAEKFLNVDLPSRLLSWEEQRNYHILPEACYGGNAPDARHDADE